MSETNAKSGRFDQEITAVEHDISAARYTEALSALDKIVSDLRPAADMFYTAWRIERIVKKVRGPSFPAPGPVPLAQSDIAVVKAAEDFFYKCLAKLNDKIRRDKDAIVSGKVNEREAFAVAAIRFLEQMGRNFRLHLKTNQARLDQKIAAEDIEFD